MTERVMTPCRAEQVNAAPYLPRHVEKVYRANDLRDAFQDAAGRVWYAGTDELRRDLPGDPASYAKIPWQFWHPVAAAKAKEQQHAAAKSQYDEDRAEIDIRGRRRDLEVVP